MPFTGSVHSLPAGTIIANGAVSDATVQHNAPFNDVSAALTVVKTLVDAHTTELANVITMSDLGALANGTDDGIRITNAIYARWGGQTSGMNQKYYEVHGENGKTYTLTTPIITRNSRIRFIGNGAKIIFTGATAFNIQRDLPGGAAYGGAEELKIHGWDFDGTGGGLIAVYAEQASNFLEVSNNRFQNCVTAVDVNGVEVIIKDNYIRGLSGDGVILRSATLHGGSISESDRCVVSNNKIWLCGGYGLRLYYGFGHMIQGNDLEVNALGDIYGQCCAASVYDANYFETSATKTCIKLDNTAGPVVVAGRITSNNIISSSQFGGSPALDVSITGSLNKIMTQTIWAASNITIGATSSGNYIAPQATTISVTDSGGGTVNRASLANLLLVTSTSPDNVQIKNPRGQFDVTGATTSGTVTFGTAETDQTYAITFSSFTYSGTPVAGAANIRMTTRGTGSFGWAIDAANGASTTRYHWKMERGY